MNQRFWTTWLHFTFWINPKQFSTLQPTTEYINITARWCLKEIKSAKKVKYWLEEFQKKVNKLSGNQHLQFTAEIWTTEANPPLPVKEDKVQIVTNGEFPFLAIKMSWSPEWYLQFVP